MLQFKTLMGVVFKPHRLLGDAFHPGQAGRQDPTEEAIAVLASGIVWLRGMAQYSGGRGVGS